MCIVDPCKHITFPTNADRDANIISYDMASRLSPDDMSVADLPHRGNRCFQDGCHTYNNIAHM